MRRASFAPRALVEYESAATWYAGQNPIAARRFRLAVSESTARILAAPERWPLLDHGCRRIRLSKFPYFLYYIEKQSVVHIVAIVHAHRHPDAWLVPPELDTSQD